MDLTNMQLWTDYEGVTIDDAYPLQKLLIPEGRSAFYSTTGRNGEPRVVRLIECHFDEEEILTRWRSVAALNHPNFLKFEHFGQTEIDGRPVVYAVLEKVDANLAEVLSRGTLSADDAAQLGLSLVAALDVLHTHGFIHEHVEPRNIFALDDTVKLRSDCIREAPEGEEGRAAKQRDVHGLVKVLLQGLTLRESIDGIPDSALTQPFRQIIRNGLDGTWSLEHIRTALEGYSRSKQPSAPELENITPAATAAHQRTAPVAAAQTAIPPAARLPLPNRELNAGSVYASIRKEPRDEDKSWFLSSRWLSVAGIAVLFVAISVWAFEHRQGAGSHEATHASDVSQSAAQPSAQAIQPVSSSQVPAVSANKVPPVGVPTSAGHRAGWRVIAYTYNRRADAEKKVSSLSTSHPELVPAVFTTSGHSPFLVSIGGVMDQQAASALAHRSRSLGLPSDMYAQNYSR
jgi:hypothetical protein